MQESLFGRAKLFAKNPKEGAKSTRRAELAGRTDSIHLSMSAFNHASMEKRAADERCDRAASLGALSAINHFVPRETRLLHAPARYNALRIEFDGAPKCRPVQPACAADDVGPDIETRVGFPLGENGDLARTRSRVPNLAFRARLSPSLSRRLCSSAARPSRRIGYRTATPDRFARAN